MVILKGAGSDSARRATSIARRRDDLSGYAHRQLIGYVGLVLPILLYVLAGLRPVDGLERWRVLDSVSAYYYSGAVAAFVGMLVVLALFLFTYRGYRNEYHWADRAAALTGGFAALGVAFFPSPAPAEVFAPSWWTPATGVLHYASAVVLFGVFAVFSLWLFRLTSGEEKPAADKRWRNDVYLVCGIVIVGSVIWAGIAGLNGKPIFLPESVALIAFAISWLVKGYAHRTITNAVLSIVPTLKRMLRNGGNQDGK